MVLAQEPRCQRHAFRPRDSVPHESERIRQGADGLAPAEERENRQAVLLFTESAPRGSGPGPAGELPRRGIERRPVLDPSRSERVRSGPAGIQGLGRRSTSVRRVQLSPASGGRRRPCTLDRTGARIPRGVLAEDGVGPAGRSCRNPDERRLLPSTDDSQVGPVRFCRQVAASQFRGRSSKL
jgi:hypothetical protein